MIWVGKAALGLGLLAFLAAAIMLNWAWWWMAFAAVMFVTVLG